MKKLLPIAACLMAGMMQFGVASADTQVRIDHSKAYDNAGKPRVVQYTKFSTEPVATPAERINVGYLVTGDEGMLLDDETMGYIRRMLNSKFPGGNYPAKRMENTSGYYQSGRRNWGDQYNLKEAHDILVREYEELEKMYKPIPERTVVENTHVTGKNIGTGIFGAGMHYKADGSNIAGGLIGYGGRGYYDPINGGIGYGSGGILGGFAGAESVVDRVTGGWLGAGMSESNGTRNARENFDSLGEANTYRFMEHLSTLPKEEYIRIARELKAAGKYSYDYLLLFNIHCVNDQNKRKGFGKSKWSDFSISVKAIDINSGEYIDRAEYLKRGYSGGSVFNSPSWRRGMRRAIVDGMIECFDNIPIGKYSVCDSDYCERRQRERYEQQAFGRVKRHCVQHCHDVDPLDCSDHMVNYAFDADLPSKYVDYEHNHID